VGSGVAYATIATNNNNMVAIGGAGAD